MAIEANENAVKNNTLLVIILIFLFVANIGIIFEKTKFIVFVLIQETDFLSFYFAVSLVLLLCFMDLQ